jgi:large subunit ribosomal protein L10
MNRQEKEAVIASLKTGLDQSSASFIVGVAGMTVGQFETIRGSLRQEGGKLHVAKVRLMKRAMQDSQCAQGLEPYLKEQIALVFAQQEAPIIAKVLCGFAKKNEGFSVLAGCMDNAVLDQDAVNIIASLPPREVLLAQLAATLNAPITSLAYLLHQLIARLVYVLKAIEAKKNS